MPRHRCLHLKSSLPWRSFTPPFFHCQGTAGIRLFVGFVYERLTYDFPLVFRLPSVCPPPVREADPEGEDTLVRVFPDSLCNLSGTSEFRHSSRALLARYYLLFCYLWQLVGVKPSEVAISHIYAN